MNCKTVQARLSAYVDAELTGHEMLELRRHLDACEGCRAEERAERALKSMLGDAPAVEPPADLELRLLRALDAEPKRTPARPLLRPAIVYAGLAAVAMFATLTFLDRTPTSETVAERGPDASSLIRRDQAFTASADPLSGGQAAMPASYVGR